MPRKRTLDVQDVAGEAIEKGGLDAAPKAQRASWIHERQVELERVADHHDELVCSLSLRHSNVLTWSLGSRALSHGKIWVDASI
jgi:hypothetical protein